MMKRSENGAQKKTPLPLAPFLERKCACGQHTTGGGECGECSKKKQAEESSGGGSLQHRASAPSSPNIAPPIVHDVLRSPGQPLDTATRQFFEPRFGQDFSQVRVHTDARAAESAQVVNALAYTVGHSVVFGEGKYSPFGSEGRSLLAHELTHIVQQNGCGTGRQLTIGEPGDHHEQEADSVERAFAQHKQTSAKGEAGTAIKEAESVKHSPSFPGMQRRLVAFGTLPDVNALLGLLGPRAGLTLNLNVANNQVQIAAVLPAAPPSAALRAQLTTIINHAAQHAEVIIGRGQPGVMVGAFPQPSDLTVTRVQQIDIDDILKIEAGAPGSGVAVVAHEIQENFVAHAAAPVAGTDLFPGAHQAAIATESAVAAQLVGPGRRVAAVSVSVGVGKNRVILDYENYYLVFRTQLNAATQNQTVTSAMRRPKIVISTRTIDNFPASTLGAPGAGATIPAAGPAVVAAAAADVAANPSATVRIEGFADDSFLDGLVSQMRATAVQAALVAAGVVDQGRIHAEGRGGVNFVAANDTPPHRALNRRVVIRVTRPGP